MTQSAVLVAALATQYKAVTRYHSSLLCTAITMHLDEGRMLFPQSIQAVFPILSCSLMLFDFMVLVLQIFVRRMTKEAC